MDIRYIYMHRDDADSHSQWMDESDNVKSQALQHAYNVMCSILVVERDPSTGFMTPLGFAASL